MPVHVCMRLVIGLTVTLLTGALDAAHAQSPRWDSGIVLETAGDGGDTFLLKLDGRLQTRYTATWPEDGADSSYFSVRRARFTLSGHLFRPTFTWELQVDFADGLGELKDGYIDYAFADMLHVRAGQWKKPFARQQLTSSGKQVLVERGIAQGAFGAGRDIGVALQSDYERGREAFEWAVGVFNGTGPVEPEDPDDDVVEQLEPELAVRLGWGTPGFTDRYSEGDLVDGPLRVAFAGAGLFDLGIGGDGAAEVRAELDFTLKGAGFAVTGAVFVLEALDGPARLDGLDLIGFHAQASYHIAGPELIPAVRYERIEGAAGDSLQELRAGVTWLIVGTALKLQMDGGMLSDSRIVDESELEVTLDDFVFRLQLHAEL